MSELDTQELKYPSSDEENYSDDTDSDQSLPDLTNLKAFDFEPTCAPREIQSSDEESEIEVDKNRIGNVTWCRCGKCQPMETDTESLCCQDTNEVPEELFEGILKIFVRKYTIKWLDK